MVILTCIIFLFLIPPLLGPITDLDFFWHLATGRWIVDHQSLPVSDPFSFATPPGPSVREGFVLQAFWLSQVLYYGIYSIAAWEGFILLRFLVIGAIVWTLSAGTKPLLIPYRIMLIGVAVLTIVHLFPLERPHVFSFLFFALTIVIIEQLTGRLREGHGFTPMTAAALLLPLTMLVWANAHPGFLLGEGVLIVYLLSEGFKFLSPSRKPMTKSHYAVFAAVGLLSVSVALLNPNTYSTVFGLITMYDVSTGLVDYESSINALTQSAMHAIPVYWLFFLGSSAVIISRIFRRTVDLKDIVLLGGLGYFSFTQVRYVPFLILWSVPVMADAVGHTSKKLLKAVFFISLALAALYLVVAYRHFDSQSLTRFREGKRIGTYFPDDACRFMLKNEIRGRMFNYYDWGGYLIWRFYPDRRVFADGRQLDESVYFQALSITAAQKEPAISGVPFYKVLLDGYGIDHILIPFFGISGQVLPLVSELTRDAAWAPVFFQGNTVVFVRNSAQHQDIVTKHAIPRKVFVDGFALYLADMMRQYPNHAHMFLVSRGDLYASYGLYPEARSAYEEALKSDPSDMATREKLKHLSR